MINSRPQSRAAVAKLQVILSKDILNDAKQVKKLFEKYGKQPDFLGFEPKEPNADVFRGIFEALSEVRILFGVAQRGGSGEDDVEELKRFVVTPMNLDTYYKQSQSGVDFDGPLPLIVGSFYRDKKSLPYTVTKDGYIVTKEDLPIFNRIYENRPRLSPEDEMFVATRLMLLYTDMIRADLEKLIASEDEEYFNNEPVPEDTVRPAIPSDVKFTEHKRIYYKISQMLDILNKIGEWMPGFRETMNAMFEAELLDNETIGALAGRDSLRNTENYNRTLEKLDTLHKTILTAMDKPITERIGEKRKRPTGGLHVEDGIGPNVEGIDIPRVRTLKHQRLQQRSRTRRTSRVRQSARKSKTR
jgi:hypothetical protein